MIEIQLGKKKYYAPFTWNEMTMRQVVSAYRVILSDMAKKIKALHLAQLMSGISFKKLIQIPIREREEKIYPLFDFLWKTTELTDNKLPSLRFGFKKFYGPTESMKKIRAREFFFAEIFFSRFLDTNDDKNLDTLIAILYREKKTRSQMRAVDYDGDPRERFNENRVDARVKYIRRMKREKKMAIYLYYLGCRKEFEKLAPHVFVKGAKSKYGWKALINGIAGVKFGTIEQTYDAFMTEILIECERILTQQEE